MIKFSLFQKGIIFVSITLLLQLAFVLALAQLLRNAHEQVQHERKVREIISQLNKLSGYADNASVGLTQQVMAPDSPDSDAFQRSYKQYLDKIPIQMQSLLTLAQGTQREKEMKELSETIHEGLVAIEKFRIAAINHSAQRDYLAIALKDVLLTKTRQISNLLESFEYEQQAEIKAESQSYDAVLYFLAFGVVANVFLAVLLVVAFTKGIATKIDRIRSNAVRLSAGLPVQAPLPKDGDELSLLDTAFHDMAESLTEAIAREQALVTNAVDVIVSLDKSGVCLDVNPAIATVFGIKPNHVIGRDFLEEMSDREKRATYDLLQSALQNEGSLKFENVMDTAEGHPIDCGWSVHWSAEDKAFFCVIHDISQRKQVERMKRDFVAMVSHDLRAPLSSVQLTLQSSLRGMYGELPNQVSEKIEVASESIDRLIGLVNGLLSVEKLESGDFDLDVNGVRADEIIVPAIQTMQGLSSQRSIRLHTLEHKNAYFYGDKERLIQVLVNLLSNAIKFAPENSQVSVGFGETSTEVKFEVTDTGRGVPKAAQEKIFDRFQQVFADDDIKLGGAGLGLSICKAIVEKHGGTIGVSSESGEGSTFWFTVPTASEDQDD